jgi:hypothetical protein
MGQMMQLRQMQQENESNNALRDFYAQGGDINKEEDRKRLLSRAPMQGQAILGKESERRARDVGTIEKRKTFFDNQIKSAVTPDHLAQITQAMYADPDVGPLLARIRPLTDSLSSIPTDPKGIEDYRRRMTLGADNLFESANAKLQAQVSREGHGVTMYGHNLTKEKNDYERRYPVMNQVITSKGVGVTPSRGPNAGVITPVNEPRATPPFAAATIFSSAGGGPLGSGTYGSPNAFVQGAPSNMLRADAQAPAAAGAAPVRAQPKPVVRQPVAVMRNGKAVMVPPDEAVGLPPASPDAEKAARLEALKVLDLGRTIKNLEAVTREGGLISQSTGSGIGRAYDVGAAFVGQATEGAIANAKLAPIADMVLKMVPRFEGPQSDKDTQSYKDAAGQLANSNLPTKIRQEAGKEILRLMKEYKDQFVSSAMDAEGILPANTPARSGDIADNAEIKAAMDWANSNPKDPRSAKIKQHFGAK